MLGGCASRAPWGIPEQLGEDKTNNPAPSQTAAPEQIRDERPLDDSETAIAPPSPELPDQANHRGADSSSQPQTYSASDTEVEFDLTWPDDPIAADQPPIIYLSTKEDSPDSEPTRAGAELPETESDLWQRIRRGFALPERQDKRITGETRWFSRNQNYLDRVADHARPYLHYIVSQVEKRGVPTEIVLLPVVESAFQPYAYSSGRAAGIWQFVAATGRRFGLKLNWWYDGRRDIVASTRAALDYLEYLNNIFDGDWLLALAAYNAGEGTVLKAIRTNQLRHRPTEFWSLRLPRETEQYVPRLLALRDLVADPEKLGIRLKPIPDEPYLTAVDIDSQLDLATAAKLADMPLEELHQLNPGFNRWATDPDGPHTLLLPLDKAEAFAAQVAQLPPEHRIQWVRHRIRRGETLGGLALQYQTTVQVLRQLNNLRGNLIRAGHYLVIPIPARTDGNREDTPPEIQREKIKHTVAAGDSLWVIARRYRTTVRQLCYWNRISPRDFLQPGQQLIVALDSSAAASIIPAVLHDTFTAPGQVAQPRKIIYRVRRGDSLARISRRFKVSVAQLRRWNGIKGNPYLQPGQELTVYVLLTADSEKS